MRAGLSGAAGLASIGAGSIHTAAAAAHGDSAPAMASFAALAVCQAGWGVLALRAPGSRLIVAGALTNLVALGGWLMAKAAGVGFVRGLEHAEPAQPADILAALLAALTVACCLAILAGGRSGGARLALGPVPASTLALAIAAAAVAGVTATAGHAHGERHSRAGSHHDGAQRDAPHRRVSARHDVARRVREAPRSAKHRMREVDLGGAGGVTAAQRARAERLVAVTRRRLPRFAQVATAEAAGYVSIGDAASGYEHYVKWSYVNDGMLLDPAHAESLVYRADGEDRTLVAAMYMLGEGATLDTVPDVGGRLTQWHIHDDLCFTDDPAAPVVAAIAAPGAACPPPLTKRGRIPMLHVWIVPHECGPFAALEGIAAGQVKDGEQPRCDHADGASGRLGEAAR